MIGKVVLARTSRIKQDFISSSFQYKFFPDVSKSVLTDVSIQIPQASINNIKQVGTRDLSGVHLYKFTPATINLRWICDRTEASNKFLNSILYFQSKTSGLVKFTSDQLYQNQFSFITSCSIDTQGLNPTIYDIGLTFFNIEDVYSSGFDPIEFIGITFTETENQIKIEEQNNNNLITSESYSVFMRGDLKHGLNGYRSLKFGEATLSQSQTYINDSYTPSFLYNEYANEDSGSIQVSRSLTSDNPRSYSASRQIILTATGSKLVDLGY
jgi:hypothetical protein